MVRGFVLAIAPLGLLGWGTLLGRAAGPFWLGARCDPEYAYLLNSLALTQGLRVGHSDHPGSALQSLGAVVLWSAHQVSGDSGPLIMSVLRDPERYLRLLHAALLAGSALSVAAAGALGLRATGRLAPGLALQCGALLAVTVQQSLHRVSPEPLAAALAVLVAGLTFMAVVEPSWAPRRLSLATGLVCGIGLAAKVTFAPVLIVPLLALSGWQPRVLCLAGAAGSFGVLVLNPLMDPRAFAAFVGNLARHEGYGAPAVPGTGLGEVLRGGSLQLLGALWRHDKGTLFTMAATLAAAAAAWARPGLRASLGYGLRRGLLGVALALLAACALVSAGPASGDPDAGLHHFVPGAALVGLAHALLGQAFPVRRAGQLTRPGLEAVAMAACLLANARPLLSLPGSLARTRAEWSGAHERVARLSEDAAIVTYYRASDPLQALELGSAFSRGHFQQALGRLYPGQVTYNPWDRTFARDFGGRSTTLAELLSEHRRAVVQGQREVEVAVPPDLAGRVVYESPAERVVVVER